jgi:hypothetical protein
VSPSEDPIDEALEEELRRHPGHAIPVAVTFTGSCSAEELDQLGLYPGDSGDASVGYGELDAEAIRLLSEREDVVAISSTTVPPAPTPPTEPEPSPSRGADKISPDLAMELDLQPGATLPVVVTFREPPGDETMADLGLLQGGPTTGAGSFDAEAIHRLAERPDVILISWTRPPRLLKHP